MKSFLLLIVIAAAAAAQDVPPNDRATGRGVTQTERPNQTMDRGRIGSEASVPDKPLMWKGILVDAGCHDRSIDNLKKPPALSPAAAPDKPSGEGSAPADSAVASHGISVDQKTAEAERGRPLEAHTPDHLTRQMDQSCAIGGDTRGFALLLSNGTLLNLDEGGNTKAYELFQSSAAGKAILNGQPGGEKPHATIKGIRRGDKLDVITIRLR